MGIFGKILIVLNLLAMGGVTYLATLDWNKRQEWAYSAFSHELRVKGLPVEATLPAPTDLDPEQFAFDFNGESAKLTAIKKTTLRGLIPAGAGEFGTGEIANQTDELKRVQTLLTTNITGIADLAARRQALLRYMINLSQEGAERDGLYALLRDVHDTNRFRTARSDLAFLGSTPSTQTALAALVALSDLDRAVKLNAPESQTTPLREFARNAFAASALADYPNSISIPSGGTREQRINQQEELARVRRGPLDRLVKAALAQNASDAALDPLKTAVVGSTADEGERAQLVRIAQIAGNLLDTDAKRQEGFALLKKLVEDRATSAPEKRALTEAMKIITGETNDLSQTALDAGLALFEAKFEDALAPTDQTKSIAVNITGKELQSESDKRRKIAHILYHLDSDQPWTNRGQWHQRVASIVGMAIYADVVEAQASRLFNATQRLEQLILNDQANFESQYAELVRQAQYLADVLNTVEEQRFAEQNLATSHDSDVKQRQGERDELVTELANNRTAAAKSIGAFKEQQRRLVEATTRLREAQDSIATLEEKIRTLEVKIQDKK